jgi:hypothetical protein
VGNGNAAEETDGEQARHQLTIGHGDHVSFEICLLRSSDRLRILGVYL